PRRRLCLSFTDPAPTRIYALSLHDALPISRRCLRRRFPPSPRRPRGRSCWTRACSSATSGGACYRPTARTPRPSCGRCSTPCTRSEEHTSELQSRENLVCRLLLEKKKRQQE